jgi:hypothetical protein
VVGDLARWLRDEEASGPARAARPSAISACPLRCRIKPYWIKAALPAAPTHTCRRDALTANAPRQRAAYWQAAVVQINCSINFYTFQAIPGLANFTRIRCCLRPPALSTTFHLVDGS